MKKETVRSITIICLGNNIVTDDGAGFAVYEHLSRCGLPENINIHYLGLGGISLLDIMDKEDALIIVDAFHLGSEPGTLHMYDWKDLPGRESHSISNHTLNLKDIISVGRLLYPEKMPRAITVIGIEGECFNEFGETLTAPARKGVNEAISEIKSMLSRSPQNPINNEVKSIGCSISQ